MSLVGVEKENLTPAAQLGRIFLSFLPQHHYKFPTEHVQWLIMFVCFSIWNLILYVKLSSEGYISLSIIPLATQEHSLSIKKAS